MKVEIDQSGRIEQLDTNTIIGYANGHSDAVEIQVSTKRKLKQQLSSRLYPNRDLPAVIFAVCIFILIFKNLKITAIDIDEEYSGKEEIITKTLDKLLKSTKHPTYITIRFRRIGKNSPAHYLVWNLHREKRNPKYRRLLLSEILSWFWRK
ncbi:MAG: hypothetical protein AAB768_01130 [Patescibacteria group bacterium]